MSRQREILSTPTPSDEAGFTLVEAMIAIVILIFGLMAVSNLMLVATSSTSVANQGTAAAVVASEVLETMRAAPWPMTPWPWGATPNILAPGGDPTWTGDVGTTIPCNDLADPAGPLTYNCDADLPGVGRIHARWLITLIGIRTIQIEVRAEGTGALSGARSRATFGMFRACTEPPQPPALQPCPDPPPGGGL